MAEILGIIGGSGLYEMPGLNIIDEKVVDTPYGKPSDSLMICEFNGKPVIFLPRHGRGHIHSPTDINYRANIYALKMQGVTSIVSVSATGSLRDGILPGTLLIPDQLVDLTKRRISSFFTNGVAGHVSFAEPFCQKLIRVIKKGADRSGVNIEFDGTYVCIEGPQFSTRAESRTYKKLGYDIIGMTNSPESKLAREAQICYATIALVTDYDVWKEETVTVDQVVATIKKNVENVQKLLSGIIETFSQKECQCRKSLEGAIMTDEKFISDEEKKKLEILYK